MATRVAIRTTTGTAIVPVGSQVKLAIEREPVVKCAPESAEQHAGHKASYRIAKKEDFRRSP